MLRYTLSRLVQAILVMGVMSFLLFMLIGFMPGDPIETMFEGNPAMTPDLVNQMRALYGLDQPVTSRYWHWLVAALHGDFGYSSLYFRPVLDVLWPAVLQTIKLISATLLVSIPLALALGIVAARRPNGWVDSLVGAFSFAAISMPSFWMSLLLVSVFSVRLHALPATGVPLQNDASLLTQIRYMILPVTVMSLFYVGPLIRYVRASMLETLSADYIRTARAKGLSEAAVLIRHALPNALVPLITVLALSFGHLFSGALVVETIFGMLGMGKMIYSGVTNVDFNLALVGLLFVTFLVLASNLLADLAYAYLDPRIVL
ncbi:MAG: ABC transporter permease [Sphingomonas sp.]